MWGLLSVVTVILVSACQAQSSRKERRPQSFRPSQDFSLFSQSSRQSSAMASSKRRNSDVYMARRKSNDMAKRPNIILMLTDDQDKDLGSLEFMPKLRRFVREKGTVFDSGFSTTPMCCPSRSSLLTGLYVHNHKVFTNNDNCSSTFWVQNHEDKTFGRYLQDSGYKTAYFGKYLNKYNGEHIPRGWEEWQGLIRNSRFYNYSLNVNGVRHQHGDNYEKDYLPDVITNRTISFLQQTKQKDPNSPFMAVLSYPGPHGPEDSAPQYSNLFFNVTTHKTPAYDFAPNPDKQWILRHTDKMADIHKSFTDILMTKRLQTLQSVDDAVERLHNELERLGQLDNTYIFYTSDHGYHLGQYGLVKGKAFPFDVDTKIPFLVRGPGVSRQVVRSEPVALIDLAPTFLDIAGLEKPPHMDGESLIPLLKQTGAKNAKPWRDTILIERGKLSFERYAKITNQKVVNEVNPENVDGTHILKKDRFTKQERLQLECQKPRYQAPCQVHQKWWCKEKSDGTKKMARCRTGLERFRGERSARNNCHCQPGEIFGWKYAKLGEDERKMQRKFLKKHIMGEPGSLKKMKPRFLMTLPLMGQMATRRVRSVSNNEPTGDSVVDAVLSDMSHEEIEEVDFLMEDISEEIQDLHALKNVTAEGMPVGNSSMELDSCSMDNGQHVHCSNEVMTDKRAWKSSRSHIRQQIQRLRAQLNELKQIRKYLRMKRPEIGNVTIPEGGRKEKKKFELPGKSLGKKKQMDRRFLSTKLGAYSLQPTYDTPDDAEICLCTNKQKNIMKERIKEERARMREERKLERLARKERRKARQEKKKNQSRGRMEHCVQDIKMNCFSHDNEHWKTAPLWTEGPFCACTNSNNNTYWCARTVNSTHNYLYCEFVTGMVMYFDMRVDPHQLRNVLHTLTVEEINYMHSQVITLREYSAETEYLKEERRLRKLELAKRKLSNQKKADKRRKEKTRKDRRKAKRRLLPAGENHEEYPLWQAARYTRRRRINRKNVQRG